MMMKVSFDHSNSESSNITTFFFEASESVSYTAGQFIELTIPHENPDERGIKRWFTLSSSPTQDLLSITTQFTESDGSSFKSTLKNLTPGIEVSMSSPLGDFVLPKLMQTPLIFVAGGVGITPFHSIFTWMGDMHETRKIKFIYSVATEDEIIFQETFEKANIHATIVVDNPSAAWGGVRGSVTADMILGLEQPTKDTLIYISGPEQMVDTLFESLKQAGISHQQIVTDEFSGYKKKLS
jgi:ferredoxin-NADP reductase